MKCKYPNEICGNMTLYHAKAYCDSVPCSLRDELPPQTNGDYMRSMTDKELAEYIVLSLDMEFEVCRYCKYGNTVSDDRGQCLISRGHCIAEERCEALKKWLVKPREDKNYGI